jgi:hypothetical protein
MSEKKGFLLLANFPFELAIFLSIFFKFKLENDTNRIFTI